MWISTHLALLTPTFGNFGADLRLLQSLGAALILSSWLAGAKIDECLLVASLERAAGPTQNSLQVLVGLHAKDIGALRRPVLI